MIHQERTIFLEVKVTAIARKSSCLIVNGYQDRAMWIYNTKSLWMVIKKEKLPTINLILTYCLNGKFVTQKWNLMWYTINVGKFQTKPQFTLQLICEDRMLFELSWSSHSFTWAAACKMQASNMPYVSTFHL
jgi:hypothetical protein